LAEKIHAVTQLPLTILGGAGTLAHIGALIQKHGIIGASAGSMFVFKGVYRAVLINYPSPEEKDNLIKENLTIPR
jgi:imidazole glycerol-phosphate synthase subunit HisF